MPDINWGGDETTAPFSSRLDETAGNFILAEDNDGSTVLLEWDGSTWQYRGPVEMNGEDISGVGTLTATDVTVSGTVDAGAVNAGETNTESSVTVTGEQDPDGTVLYGRDHGSDPATESVSVGVGARPNSDDGSGGSINGHVAVGYEAARDNTGFGVAAVGYQTAQSNTGDRLTAAGYQAARDNTTSNVTAVGYQTAQSNTGDRLTAVGYQTAQSNTGFGVTAAGYRAARNNTGDNVIAVGHQAAQNNTGGGVTAAGYRAAQNNTGFGVTAAGYRAARGDGLSDPTTMGDENIGIGESAIRNNQASGLIAIGQEAGINAQADDQLIITQRDGSRRMVMDLTTGDLQITGSLTENATL